MTGNELRQCLGVEFATRDLEMLREILGLVENLVRNGDGGLHTKSITAEGDSIQPKSRGGCGLAALANVPVFSGEGQRERSDRQARLLQRLVGRRSASAHCQFPP